MTWKLITRQLMEDLLAMLTPNRGYSKTRLKQIVTDYF